MHRLMKSFGRWTTSGGCKYLIPIDYTQTRLCTSKFYNLHCFKINENRNVFFFVTGWARIYTLITSTTSPALPNLYFCKLVSCMFFFIPLVTLCCRRKSAVGHIAASINWLALRMRDDRDSSCRCNPNFIKLKINFQYFRIQFHRNG